MNSLSKLIAFSFVSIFAGPAAADDALLDKVIAGNTESVSRVAQVSYEAEFRATYEN